MHIMPPTPTHSRSLSRSPLLQYTGEAINPKHLSLFERWMGYGKGYVYEAPSPASSESGDDAKSAPSPPSLELQQQQHQEEQQQQ